MRTKHLCVLIHFRIKGEVGTVKHILVLQYFALIILLWILFLLFMLRVCLCYAVLSVLCSLVITFRERADLMALLYVMFSSVFCHFPIWCPGQVCYLIVSIPDLYLFLYLNQLFDAHAVLY